MSTATTTKLGMFLPLANSAGWDTLINNNFTKLDKLLGTCEIDGSGGYKTLTLPMYGFYKVEGVASQPNYFQVLPNNQTTGFKNNTKLDLFVGSTEADEKDYIRIAAGESVVISWNGDKPCVVGQSSGSDSSVFQTQSTLGCSMFYRSGNQTYMRNLVSGDGVGLRKEGENIKVGLDFSKLTTTSASALAACLGIDKLNTQYKVKVRSDDKPGYLLDKLQVATPLELGLNTQHSGSYKLSLGLNTKKIPQGKITSLVGVGECGLQQQSVDEFLCDAEGSLGNGAYLTLGKVLNQKCQFTDLAEGTYQIVWPVEFVEPPNVWTQFNLGLDTVAHVTNITNLGAELSIITTQPDVAVSGCVFMQGAI